jgi:hypothetical protein
MVEKRPLKVGFDLDGVILYNPVRTVRPVLALIRRLLIRKKKTSFYIPKSKLEKIMWFIIHKSSLFLAPGVKDLQKLIEEGKIEAYLISGRYDSLKGDFDKWMEKIEAQKYFKAYLHNKNEEQPYAFKKRMIAKYKLDYFVEDNWDIIQLLNGDNSPTKILWVSNLLDQFTHYERQFHSLRDAIGYLEKLTR